MASLLGGTSDTRSTIDELLPEIVQLNQSLYELHRPADGVTPKLEVIFFHGLHQHGSSSRELDFNTGRPCVDTWTSYDGHKIFCWPQKLLPAEFPAARIISVSYDSSATKRWTEGIMDPYLVAENLLHDLTQKNVGHKAGCPMILVGKDIGGLVIKRVCLRADQERHTEERYQFFLKDIYGILYYCTPHRGFSQMPSRFTGAMVQKLGFQDAKEIVRVGEEFRKLRTRLKWRTKAVGNLSIESELCIPEGSLRDDVDNYYTVPHTLHSIARPCEQTDIAYGFLSDFMREAPGEAISDVRVHKLPPIFEIDKKYVPMNGTLQKLWKAFEKPDVNIVLLYGDSGKGKSSIARHFAKCFQEEAPMKKMGREGGCSSPFACYISCGREAVAANIQDQLLWEFHMKEHQDCEALGTERAPQSQEMHSARYRAKLLSSLRDFDALVVLDDVWHSQIVEEVLVPGIKYLITSRDAYLWPDGCAEAVEIEDVNRDDARKILANYAEFEDSCIPRQLQAQADALIHDVGSHPLALATLGTVLRKHKSDADEWNNVRNDFLIYLESERHKSINYGIAYPRSVSAALMLMVDPEILSADVMHLLLVINLFKGPEISESVVKTFLRYLQPTALKRCNAHIKVLEAFSLIQVKTIPACSCLNLRYIGKVDANTYKLQAEKATFQYRSRRAFLIHDLRQRFILAQKKEDMDAVKRFLEERRDFFFRGNRSKDDWAIVLCAIFGESNIQREAQQKMDRFYKWSLHHVCATPILVFPPREKSGRVVGSPEYQVLVSRTSRLLEAALDLFSAGAEEHRLDDEPSTSIVRTCTEVLWTLLVNHRIDGERISMLLKEKKFIGWTCHFLATPVSYFGVARQFNDAEIAFRDYANTLIAILAQNVPLTVKKQVLLILTIMTNVTDPQVFSNSAQECLLDTDKLLHTLTSGEFLGKEQSQACALSSILIQQLAEKPNQGSVIVKTPGCLDKLVDLLAEDVAPNLQEPALSAIRAIANHHPPENPGIFNAFMCAQVTTHLVQRLVTFLSKDLGKMCKLSSEVVALFGRAPGFAVRFVNTSGCLHKLLDLLSEDVEVVLQQAALSAIGRIVDHDIENASVFAAFVQIGITNFLQKLVTLMSEDLGKRCELSVKVLQALATSSGFAMEIVNMSDCLHKLLELLSKDVATDLQESALMALWRVANHDSDENPGIFDAFGHALITTNLLERVATFLSKDMGCRCKMATRLISILARAPGFAVKLVNLPSCLHKLLELLSEDVAVDLQESALFALWSVAHHYTDENPCIFDAFGHALITTNMLERVVTFLSKDMGYTVRCKMSLGLIEILARARDFAVKLVNLPSCLHKLLELLSEDVAVDLQACALLALLTIANHDLDKNPGISDAFGRAVFATNVLQGVVTTNLLQSVVTFLSKDTGDRCKLSAAIVDKLAGAPAGLEMIVHSSNCLHKLIELLIEEVTADLQEAALETLGKIAANAHGENVAAFESFVQFTTNFLSRVVSFLSKHLGRRCELSARLIWVLASAPDCVVEIIHTSRCLHKLTELLTEDVAVDLQEASLAALYSISGHVRQNQIVSSAFGNLLLTTNLLDKAVTFLSKSMGERCRLSAGFIGALAESPSGPATIISSSSCLDKLTELLGEEVTADQQEAALSALLNTSRCAETGNPNIFDAFVHAKAIGTTNLVQRVLRFLSKDLGRRCILSAGFIGVLAKKPDYAVMIVNTPGSLHRLVDLLTEDVAADLQEYALHALCSIGSYVAARNPIFFNAFAPFIPTLLQRVNTFISEDPDMRPRCQAAVSLVLVMGPQLASQASRLRVHLSGCLKRLAIASLFKEDMHIKTQNIASAAMLQIALAGHEANKDKVLNPIFASSDVFQHMVMALSTGISNQCITPMSIISFLAEDPAYTRSVAMFPGCLDGLVKLLARGGGDFGFLQTRSMRAIFRIAMCDEEEVRNKLLETQGLLEAVIALLGEEVPEQISVHAAVTLGRLPVRDAVEKLICNMRVRPNILAIIYRGRYIVYAMRKTYPAALDDINKAIELDSEDGFLWQERGVLHRLMNDYGGALRDLDRALDIDTDDYECLKHRAFVKFLLNDKEGACADAERAILVKPSRVDCDSSRDSYGQNCLGVLSVQFMTYNLK